ncbi:unannotated protein [freshwater metagenome]|uniref:Unannotated protein n=1 Tax=freshwater metagenome TaxID=449393 RepID=A0A6J7FKI0_9ZZZZ
MPMPATASPTYSTVPAPCSTPTNVNTPPMSSTVDQLIWLIAPFCALGDARARTTATVIDTKPTSRSRTSENNASEASPTSVRI